MTRYGTEIRAGVVATLVMGLVCGGLYPLVVWAIAQRLFPAQANGSLMVDGDGTVRGSRWMGQAFAEARYFHPRPSAAGTGYDAASSGGRNLGPTSRKLRDAIAEGVAAYRRENGLADDAVVPADAVTASGSGLDPHISPQNATLQAARVARARGIPEADLQARIAHATEMPQLGILGEPRVNVLQLNRSLDAHGYFASDGPRRD
ncbi:MAG: K(+)-transporting ATPase subunit C [Lentisphaerae bacterium]|nr:K(+)-transporting ATPase subunit C [Lentisphaerota bacterium]